MDLVDEAWGAAIHSAAFLEKPASLRDLPTASRLVAGDCLSPDGICPTKVVVEGSQSPVTGGLETKAGLAKLGLQEVVEHWIGAAWSEPW